MISRRRQVNLLQSAIDLTLIDPRAYMVLNQMDITLSNPLYNAVVLGLVQHVQILLECVPIVDLDVYSFPRHRWRSAEEWVQDMKTPDGSIAAMVRCAREGLETYRVERTDNVTKHCDLPLAVCNIINAYGARPNKDKV